jgi:hypothetical protein
MNIGDYARYKNTGTVGKVLEVKQEAGVEWILLDTFNLYYDSTTLEPGLEVEYKTSSVKERTTGLTVEDIEAMKEEISKVERYGSITASGGG